MEYKLIGSPCGEHGPYTFYKAFRYTKNGRTSILSLSEFFFVKLWTDSDLISIGELQLLWEDRNSEQTLASLRLYILPENTPEGRCDIHGEDEVLAITEKVVLRVEDLLTWITQATDWNWGLGAVWERDCPEVAPAKDGLPTTGPNRIAIDMDDVNKEKQLLDVKHWETNTGVVVLSYPRYCRYRGVLKRLEGVHNKWLRTGLVVALGGFTAPCKNTRVLFCKDTFDYPELEGHELLCNHLAPKLKGRPRRKRKKQSVSPEGSESESESSQSTSSSQASKPKIGLVKPRLRCTLEVKRTTRGPNTEEKNFLNSLHIFMSDRKTPISRIPIVGFKEVNLFKLYRKVIELGGYDIVTGGKMWKHVYEVMGGDMGNSSAATLSRRHYEKLLLPYERYLSGKSQITKTISKPLPAIGAATSPNSKPEIKHVPKSSSLRSIRLKQEKVVAVGEKENIPQKVASPPKPVIKSEPEIIDLANDDSPVKVVPPPLAPMVKKQKLEILKEGGLEVTPIGGGGGGGGARASVIKLGAGGATVTAALPPPAPSPPQTHPPIITAVKPSIAPMKPPPPPPLPAPSVVNNNNNKKISITVTPDMTHLMYPPGPSKKPVYGNPKEVLAIQPKNRSSLVPEVLDLRTKPKIHTPPALQIGSNLEITLVPPNKSRQQAVMMTTMAPPPKKRLAQPQHHIPSMYLHQQPRTTLIVPQRPQPAASFNNHQRHQPKSAPAVPPPATGYIPVVDPIYLSALYNGIFAPPMFQTGGGEGGGAHLHHHQGAAPPSALRTTAADHLAVYKELIRRQGMFPLLQDGSTSITLVGQPTPTSK